MIAFRQLIRHGQSGRDVKAVKIAYRKMGIAGSGAMTLSKRAGPAFVHVTRVVQRHHGLHADGVYGKATHEVVAPHFTAYARWLYRTATIRELRPPPVPNFEAQTAAQQLLHFYARGKLRDDSGRCRAQIEATAQGRAVWSPAGRWVHLDRRILDALLYVLDKGHELGTFAICSDHPYDGMLGHAGGRAVDISSIDGVSVSSGAARNKTLVLAELLHHAPGALHPWQLICDGFGYQHDSAISALTIPSPGFYGYTTMSQHRNHVHYGA